MIYLALIHCNCDFIDEFMISKGILNETRILIAEAVLFWLNVQKVGLVRTWVRARRCLLSGNPGIILRQPNGTYLDAPAVFAVPGYPLQLVR